MEGWQNSRMAEWKRVGWQYGMALFGFRKLLLGYSTRSPAIELSTTSDTPFLGASPSAVVP